MNKIGVINLDSEISNSRIETLEGFNEHILLRTTEELFDELYCLDGLIIVERQPKLSTVCELILEIKKYSDCYIWIDSLSKKETEKIIYLQLGADYVFNENITNIEKKLIVRNASQRVQGVIDRHHSIQELRSEQTENIRLMADNMSIIINDTVEVLLTKSEFIIIELLAQNPQRAVSYQKIQKHVYGEDHNENFQYRLANIMHHIRKKINSCTGDKREYIKTVRSKGYMLDMKKK
ncbi:winged-helix domain-containing protein [Enterococcus ureasiticus]|uniref:winged helix-turn-helix domain-containing protein n=1 Tax=Enterococcus ureasiticus TaxID=903984 RepID=UPI001A8D3430|nr:winged helix-turn-helix domain-containing protein [Enterococcus ureasiticus]MBO0473889.1 winged-helix domain-containing protein [Enterococcus ureasiticus]